MSLHGYSCVHCYLKPRFGFSTTNNHFCSSKTLLRKPITCSSVPSLQHSSSTKHTTLLVESYHEHQSLKALIQRLKQKDSCPLQMLQHDGDWTKDHFWAVIKFLKNASRSTLILQKDRILVAGLLQSLKLEMRAQVFAMWKSLEKSRITVFNYEKIVGLLCDEGLMEEAVRALVEMKDYGLSPSLEIYNRIIGVYANNGKFDDALFFLDEMKGINLVPETDTYYGLIQAYGKYKMYNEIDMCLKKMKLDGCLPDHFTYNLLIQEFARGGLLKRMEGAYRGGLSKRMQLRSSTLAAMLKAYMDFGTVEMMDKFYKSLLQSNTFLDEDLIRKLAEVYIKNYMFSRLDDLGDDLSSRTGRTDLVWCLRLLSHACLFSRRGMVSVLQEMEEAKVSWNVSIANIILLTQLKMKNFKHLKILLSELPNRGVKPDIVTFGILYDARRFGFDGTGALVIWRRLGFLNESVEINTDPLVLTAYGKGQFLRDCEEVYTSLEPNAREKKRWTYQNLVDLVLKHNK